MAVTVVVAGHSSRYGYDFDQKVFELFPSYPAREYFRKILRQYDIGFTTAAMFARRVAELVHDQSGLVLFDLCRPFIRLEDQIEFGLCTPAHSDRTDRRIMERRYLVEDFGFDVCGGRDQDCGLFVSSVDRGSLAWKADMRPGFEIVRVNGMSTTKATHRMFVDYVKISLHLDLHIKNIGMIPRPTRIQGQNRWQFARDTVTATRVFVPSPYGSTVLKNFREPLVFIKSLQGTVLGAHIKPSSNGLLVTAIKPGSAAALAKFLPGDEITEVNELQLRGLDFQECVGHLRCETPFTLRLRREVSTT